MCGMEGRNGLDTRDDKDGLVKKRKRENVVFSLGEKKEMLHAYKKGEYTEGSIMSEGFFALTPLPQQKMRT